MQLPIQVDKSSSQSLQVQLAGQLRRLILDGRLRPGTRMPATRALAADLAISRNTVIGAFARLISEGLLQAREPIGTFVADRILGDGPARATDASFPAPENRIGKRTRVRFCARAHLLQSPGSASLEFDFWVGRPDARLFPMRTWRALLARMLQDAGPHLSEYGDPMGAPALREAIVLHVGATRGIATDADHILITSGIQEGLNLLARLLLARGVRVAVENPCYLGAAGVFASHEAELYPVAAEPHGVDPDGLPKTAALLYVTPSHQYPLGHTLPIAQREAVLAWARRTGAYIAEDDYDSDFFYEGAPLPALKSLDRDDRVIYLGTFSKSLGAGLRIGYMVLPDELCSPARHAKALLNNCQPWLAQAALATFIRDGDYARHVRRLRQLYGARCAQLQAGLRYFLPHWQLAGHGSGLHLVARLPADGPDAHCVQAGARAHGVGVYPIAQGNARLWDTASASGLDRVLLLGYAALAESDISSALLRLRSSVSMTQGVLVPAPA